MHVLVGLFLLGACRPGAAPSASELPATSDLPFTSDLPILVLSSEGWDVDAESGSEEDPEDYPKRPVTWALYEPGSDGRADPSRSPDAEGLGGIEVRGNSSQVLPKKSYALELRDAAGDDRAVGLAGLPADADWVLYAPYGDRSLLRNHLAYTWAAGLSDRWAPRSRFVELVFDQGPAGHDPDDYRGIYLLVERVERGAERVDVPRMDPDAATEPAVTGGWILKVDVPDEGDTTWQSAAGNPPFWPSNAFVAVEPDAPSAAQAAWIRAYVDGFEAALDGPSFTDPALGWAPWIDRPSFVDTHLFTEALKNADGFYASMYLHKDREGPLVAGPFWDFDVSMGGTTDWDAFEAEGWLSDEVETFWYPRLHEDPAFRAAWEARWHALREGSLSDERVVADLRAVQASLEEAQVRNFERWPILGEPIDELPHLNYPGWEDRPTWQDEVDHVEGGLLARFAWMDAQIP